MDRTRDLFELCDAYPGERAGKTIISHLRCVESLEVFVRPLKRHSLIAWEESNRKPKQSRFISPQEMKSPL